MASPSPRASKLTSCRRVGLREAFKDVLMEVTRNTDTGVDDLEADRAYVIDMVRDARANHDRALLGELDGVPDHVRQDLPETFPIAKHRTRHIVRALV